MRKMSLLALVLVILGAMACIGNASYNEHGYIPLSGEEGKGLTEEENAIDNGTDFVNWGDDDVTLTVNGQLCHLTLNPPLHTILCHFPKFVNPRSIHMALAEALENRAETSSIINVCFPKRFFFHLTELGPSASDQESHYSAVRNFSLTLSPFDSILCICLFLYLVALVVYAICFVGLLAVIVIHHILTGEVQ